MINNFIFLTKKEDDKIHIFFEEDGITLYTINKIYKITNFHIITDGRSIHSKTNIFYLYEEVNRRIVLQFTFHFDNYICRLSKETGHDYYLYGTNYIVLKFNLTKQIRLAKNNKIKNN